MCFRKVSFDNIKQGLPTVIFITIVLLDMIQGQWEFFNSYKELQWIKLLKLFILVLIGINALRTSRVLLFVIVGLVIPVVIGYGKSFFQVDVLQHLVKYLSPFIYYYGFKTLINSEKKRDICIKTTLYLVYFSLIVIIIGMVFKIDSFQTYYHRFGYKGLFKRSIDVSYFLIFSLLFLSLFRTYIKRPLVLMILILTCSIIAGTKLPWLFLALYFGYLFIKNKQLRKPILLYSIPVGIIGAGIVYFLLADKAMDTFNLFYNIYLEKGFLSSLTSYRSDLLLESFEHYKDLWQWQNLLFGGQDFGTLLVEMSIADLIIFFGFIGAGVYLLFYYNVYFKNREKSFQALYILVLIASIFAGQFFFNPRVTIWFAVLTVLVHNLRKEEVLTEEIFYVDGLKEKR